MIWGKHKIGEQEYDLSHLNPFILDVTPNVVGAPTFKTLVSFGHHTFTREWSHGINAEEFRFSHNADCRCFCPNRHKNSCHLPRIITNSARGKAYFSNQHNYLLVENIAGLNGPYAVFFKLEQAKSPKLDAVMFVVSAYEKPALPKKLPAISFATLIAKTAKGEIITRPKK